MKTTSTKKSYIARNNQEAMRPHHATSLLWRGDLGLVDRHNRIGHSGTVLSDELPAVQTPQGACWVGRGGNDERQPTEEAAC